MGSDKQKGSLGDRFEHFEHQPSKEAWDKIAAGLKDQPGALGPRFKGFEHAPNLAVWARINRRLNAGKRAAWVSIAAILLLTGGLATWYFSEWPSQNPTLGLGGIEQAPAGLNPASEGGQNFGPSNGHSLQVWSGNNPAPLANSLATKSDASFAGGSNFRKPLFQKTPYGLGDLYHAGLKKPGIRNSNLRTVPDQPWTRNDTMAMNTGVSQVEIGQSKEEKPDSVIPAPKTNLQAEEPAPVPVIEIPKAQEAEGGWSLKLGANLSNGGSLAYATMDAMMEADQNGPLGSNFASGDFPTEEYQPPFMVGASVAIPLSKRISFLPGLYYTLLQSRSTSLDAEFKRHYLGVNLSANYTLIERGGFSTYLLAGGQADAGVGAEFRSTSGTLNFVQGPKAGNQVSLMAGAGLNYHFTKHLGLYLQAMATHYLYQSQANLYSQKAIWPAAQVGLRVKL